MFGINLKERGHAMWWGARAIFRDGTIDLLWDRQQMEGGTEEQRKVFARWLDKVGLPALRKLAKEMSTTDDFEERFEKDGFFIVANPKRSHGYLYIGAAPLEVK